MTELSHPKLTNKRCPACGSKLYSLPGYEVKKKGGLDANEHKVCPKCQPMLPLTRG